MRRRARSARKSPNRSKPIRSTVPIRTRMRRSRSPISSPPTKSSAEMAWRVRAAAREDAAALALVASATFLDAFAGVLDGADLVAHCLKHNTPATFADWIDDPDSAVAVVEAVPGGAPPGYILLTAPDLPLDTGPPEPQPNPHYH